MLEFEKEKSSRALIARNVFLYYCCQGKGDITPESGSFTLDGIQVHYMKHKRTQYSMMRRPAYYE